MARIPTSSMIVDAQAPTSFEVDHTDPLAAELSAIRGNVFSGESLEAIYRGDPPGMALLAVTNRRLMYVDDDTFDDRRSVHSVPIKGVTSVAFVATDEQSVAQTTTVGITVLRTVRLMVCRDAEEARELHDMLIWNLTS